MKSTYVSFHYKRDNWRVQQVLNMGAIEGQPIVTAQEWEQVKRRGRAAIEGWIDKQMEGKSALVVLVGAETALRPWVRHEIVKAWNARIPIVGIRIHGLANRDGYTDPSGSDPFASIKLNNGRTIADYVALHAPSGRDSKAVYRSISENIEKWVTNGYKRS